MKDGGSTEQKNRMNELATAIGQANVKLGELKTKEQSLNAEIKKSTSELSGQTAAVNKAKDSLSGLATAAKVLVASYGTKKVFELMFGTNAELESYTTSFEVMLGDVEKAQGLIQKLTDMAALTPFTRSDLVSSGTLLMNYGVAADELIETLTRLGDLSSGNAEKMNRISLAYGQMLAKNKVTGEELRQMTEARVPLIKALAAELNTTTAETQKMISAGTVGIDTLNSAIETLTTGTGKFAGMMEKQSETMNGMLSTLKDYGEQIAQGIGEEGFEKVKAKLSEIIGIIDKAKADGTLDNIIEEVGEKVAGLVDFIVNLVGAAWEMRDVILAGVTALIAFKTAINIGNITVAAASGMKALTSSIKSATIAQKVFNAVGAASPVGAIVALATAGAAALVTFGIASSGAASKAEQLTNATEELNEAFDNRLADGEAEIQLLKNKAERYDELRKAESLTAEQENELKGLSEDINNNLGGNVETVDKLTGEYKDLNKEIDDYISKWQAQMKLSAYEDTTKEAYKNIIEAQKELKELEKQIEAAKNHTLDFDPMYFGIDVSGSGVASDYVRTL